MNNYKYKEQSGRSMIEMLGVLAIIGVLSVGGIAGYSKAMNKFKTNKVADNVSMIVANIKTLYAQQNTYTDLSNKNAISMGVIPDELGTNAKTGTLTNAFNGPVFVGEVDTTSTSKDQRGFYILFNGLSREGCITLATNDWGSGYSSGLIALKVSGAPIADTETNARTAAVDAKMAIGCQGSSTDFIACPGGSGLAVPMKVTTAASACSCNAGNTCSILWKYY
ncbi:MAG: type 4 pilus major pilin [Pseudomonadota bacterium]|nr:type 4 pilus major pilin [Pseudomonadota bacterium]